MQSLDSIADYFGIKKLPKIAGTQSGPLLVMCPARCVWEDVKNLDMTQFSTLAVKEVSWFFSRIFNRQLDHAASYEEEVNMEFTKDQVGEVPKWAKHLHTHPDIPVKKAHVWGVTRYCGTSGLFGLMVGVLLGYNPVLLAGSPLDDSPHFYDPSWFVYPNYTRQGQQNEWLKACKMFEGRALGLSGKPKEWLGGL